MICKILLGEAADLATIAVGFTAFVTLGLGVWSAMRRVKESELKLRREFENAKRELEVLKVADSERAIHSQRLDVETLRLHATERQAAWMHYISFIDTIIELKGEVLASRFLNGTDLSNNDRIPGLQDDPECKKWCEAIGHGIVGDDFPRVIEVCRIFFYFEKLFYLGRIYLDSPTDPDAGYLREIQSWMGLPGMEQFFDRVVNNHKWHSADFLDFMNRKVLGRNDE